VTFAGGTFELTVNNLTVKPGSTGYLSANFAAVTTVPDGGSAVALLGIALAGIEGVRRVIGSRKA
jgi:hypothetical protein